MNIKHWFHHLLNPHCEQCKEEREENKVCPSCEILKQQLEIANYDRRQMTKDLIDAYKPAPPAPPAAINYDEIKPRNIPFPVRRQMLEEEDRRKAIALRQNAESQKAAATQSVESLEKELGIEGA